MADTRTRMRRRQERGSVLRCPKCGGTAVSFDPALTAHGYGPGLATCRSCTAVWEPFDMAQIWDPDDPVCAFREPCNNCAFRPGSPEQSDPEKWRDLIAKLRGGAHFYCHKGVPIEPGTEHGFAYPKERAKLRLCRGFINAWGRWRDKDTAALAPRPADTAEGV